MDRLPEFYLEPVDRKLDGLTKARILLQKLLKAQIHFFLFEELAYYNSLIPLLLNKSVERLLVDQICLPDFTVEKIDQGLRKAIENFYHADCQHGDECVLIQFSRD